jgi:hypothetical protein
MRGRKNSPLERASGDHSSYVYDTVNTDEVSVEIFPQNV